MKNQNEPMAAIRTIKIMFCTCEHPYQDRKYGSQQRVHNPIKNGRYRCTVCLKEKDK